MKVFFSTLHKQLSPKTSDTSYFETDLNKEVFTSPHGGKYYFDSHSGTRFLGLNLVHAMLRSSTFEEALIARPKTTKFGR